MFDFLQRCEQIGNGAAPTIQTPHYGLPFGQDRIVPIYLATLAIRQKSQTIRFRTAAEMLETFGMHKGGKEYRGLVAAFERIFGATIFFGTGSLRGTARVVQRSRFSFFHEAPIWYSRDPQQYPISDQFENVIVLSDEFYREITAHPIPADLEAVKVLAGAPAVLDLFTWLSYRCFLAKDKPFSRWQARMRSSEFPKTVHHQQGFLVFGKRIKREFAPL